MKKLLLIFWILPLWTFSQQNQIIPFCQDKNIDEITKATNKRLKLFEQSDFKKAVLFQVDSQTYKIMIFSKQGKNQNIQEKILTKDSLENLRQYICKNALDRSGNISFIAGNIIASVGVYSWLVPEILNINSEKWAFIVGTTTAATGIFLPSFLTRNTSITRADALLKNYGQFSGFYDSFLLYDISYKHPSFILLASLTEGTAGYFTSHLLKLSYNQSFTIVNYGILGYYMGTNFIDWNYLNDPIVVGFKFFNSALGGIVSSLPNKEFTVGDNLIVDLFFSQGSLITDILINNNIISYWNYEKAYFISNVLTLTGGTIWGLYQDFSVKQSLLTISGSIVGGTIVGILGILPVPKNNFDLLYFFNFYSIGSTLSMAGLLTYFSLENKHYKSTNLSYNTNIFFNPTAFAFNTKNQSYQPLPMIGISVSF